MSNFETIEKAIEAYQNGEFLIVTDDENRENEGDFFIAAEKITPEAVNFMVTHGKGMVCVCITPERAKELELEQMTQVNTALHETSFTTSVDYVHGTTTGISASDRAKTINAFVDKNAKPSDLARPGHIHPIVARKGGVLQRAGHTEAVVDLAKLAGFQPCGVLCEILNEDGTMARTPELKEMAKKFGIKMITIADLIAYRQSREKLIVREVETILPTQYGEFKLFAYSTTIDDKNHLAIVKGNIDSNKPTLVRVHSECLTGDTLHSLRCDCGSQLASAMKQISEAESGVIVYMRQEGRGIGLVNKLKAYALQDKGFDTVEANKKLGFKADLREYGIGAQILKDVGVGKMKILTNNPKKIVGLDKYDLKVIERVPLEINPNQVNENYLKTKRDKLGHLILTKGSAE